MAILWRIVKTRSLVPLGPIFSPEKPYNITLTLASTLLLAYSDKKVVDWESIIGELEHMLATNTKRGQPSYIGSFLFHLYAHTNLLTNEEDTQWTLHKFRRALQTTDWEPEVGRKSKSRKKFQVHIEFLLPTHIHKTKFSTSLRREGSNHCQSLILVIRHQKST